MNRIYILWIMFFVFSSMADNVKKEHGTQMEDNTTNILFTIGDSSYTEKDFPPKFKTLLLHEKKNFISKYLYYKLFLDELEDEQKRYKVEVNESLKKKNRELNRKGIVLNELQKILFDKKIILDTISYNEVLIKYKGIDKKIKEFYIKNKEGYQFPKRIEVSHIVLKDKKKAEKILEELKNTPSDIKLFSQLVQENTVEKSTKYSGGYIGNISEKKMGKDFFDTLWNTTEEKIVFKVLKYNNYYHIIYVLKKYKAEQRTLEEEKESIKDFLLKQDIKKWKSIHFNKIKDKSSVKFYKIKL